MPKAANGGNYVDNAKWRRHITRAINMIGPTRLADYCLISIQRLRWIERKQKRCPTHIAQLIEKATDGRITKRMVAPWFKWDRIETDRKGTDNGTKTHVS